MALKYKHFKGGIYELVTVATLESDVKTKLVIYKSLTTQLTWARPWEEFFGQVKRDDYMGPRFRLIEEGNYDCHLPIPKGIDE